MLLFYQINIVAIMGLSSNIIWHQSSFETIIEILKSKTFLCSYSIETIKWRKSEIEVAFPIVSFCDLPISDMREYLTDNKTNELTGKYGDCMIGLSTKWASSLGMNHVWYLDPKSEYLRQTLPRKTELIKSLKSTRFPNRWLLLSRIKPFTGSLQSKGFVNYRFYDEKEVRYVPEPSILDKLELNRVLTNEEYLKYKEERRRQTGRPKGDGIIPNLGIKFQFSDIKFVLCSTIEQESQLRDILEKQAESIIFMTYPQVVEDIIGAGHFEKKS